MSFLIYDLTFLVLFSLAIGLFLWFERKKLKREGIMFLYKTSIGLKLIDYIGKKYQKTLKFLSYISIGIGYILMVGSIYLLIQLVYLFTKPEIVQAVKVPPIMPLIPYLPALFKIDYLPPFYFTYWILAIALVAIFHEGFHGIFARFYNIKIKSTGFGFLGPFLAFFVEQDEKQMQKAKPFAQMSMLSAGVFANVLLSVIFFLFMVWFFNAAYTPSGVLFNDYSYSVATIGMMSSAAVMNETLKVDGITLVKIKINNESYYVSEAVFEINKSKVENTTLVKLYQDLPAIKVGMRGAITSINGIAVLDDKQLSKILNSYKPGDSIIIITEEKTNTNTTNFEYSIRLETAYDNESRAVIGVATFMPKTGALKIVISKMINSFKNPNIYYTPKINPDFTIFFYTLLWWIFVINISVAIANMIPIAIFDGGRFFYLTILVITKRKKWAEKSFKYMTWFLLGLLSLSMVLYFIGIF